MINCPAFSKTQNIFIIFSVIWMNIHSWSQVKKKERINFTFHFTWCCCFVRCLCRVRFSCLLLIPFFSLGFVIMCILYWAACFNRFRCFICFIWCASIFLRTRFRVFCLSFVTFFSLTWIYSALITTKTAWMVNEWAVKYLFMARTLHQIVCITVQ